MGITVLEIICIPFFIVGLIQTFRGILSIIDADAKKLTELNNPWCWILIPASILGYIIVIALLFSSITNLYG